MPPPRPRLFRTYGLASLAAALVASSMLLGGCVGRGNGNSAGPSQNEGTVPAAARDVQTPFVSSCANGVSPGQAAGLVNQEVTLVGPVINVDQPAGAQQPTILNVGASYPAANNISVVIPSRKLSAFPENPASLYTGKNVCVVGVVVTYMQRKAIFASSPDDIAVISQQ